MRSPGLASCGSCMRDASTVIEELASIARQLEHDRRALEADAQKWQERTSLLQASSVPAPIRERADSMETKLEGASARIARVPVIACWSRSTARCRCWRASMTRAPSSRRRRRASARNGCNWRSRSLWQLGAAPARFDVVAAEVATAWRSLRDYLRARGALLAALFVGVLALTGWLFTRGPQGAGRRGAPMADRLPHRCSSL